MPKTTKNPRKQRAAESAEPITWDTSGGGIYFIGEGKSLVIERSGLDSQPVAQSRRRTVCSRGQGDHYQHDD